MVCQYKFSEKKEFKTLLKHISNLSIPSKFLWLGFFELLNT